jgi:hypothetical protein
MLRILMAHLSSQAGLIAKAASQVTLFLPDIWLENPPTRNARRLGLENGPA